MSTTDQEIPPGLIYVLDTSPGITRRKWGRGYSYFLPSGERISRGKLRDRIIELKIPPAWEDVWICPEDRGHLQATGYDNAKRKQYIYHPQWTAYSNKVKYEKLAEFGEDLPRIRARYQKHLKRPKWDKKKVLALAVGVLDELHLRVGNSQYTDANNTYGLTTLRRKHFEIVDGVAHLRYRAKRGKERDLSLEDDQLKKLLRECSELPGYEIFRYKEKGRYRSIDSNDLNSYLNMDGLQNQYTAKDFRTWGANCLLLNKAKEAKRECEKNPRKKLETTLIRMVAEEIGNTISICRDYYIDPRVLREAKESNIPLQFKRRAKGFEPMERWLLNILKK